MYDQISVFLPLVGTEVATEVCKFLEIFMEGGTRPSKRVRDCKFVGYARHGAMQMSSTRDRLIYSETHRKIMHLSRNVCNLHPHGPAHALEHTLFSSLRDPIISQAVVGPETE